ncbi:hypothetical protein BOO71_0011581 [Deinococcus marmoris]|uniref:Uncharacterized protein n=1 Tax=Deinococcus marmoris TaxID=249408 RepID=A0A1U7NUC1_9DEIO|nr:hypothetical protein BOO71_0011581 [Deinococcus marmoris]
MPRVDSEVRRQRLTAQDEGKQLYGFRLFRAGIGTAPIPPLHARNPFFSCSLRSDYGCFQHPSIGVRISARRSSSERHA